MEIVNATKMIAGYTMGMDPAGRESVVVAVKGTFGIPSSPKHSPKLLEEQVPLILADDFTGEPGFSATLNECDYAPEKPKCDVILNGSAYAPGGNPTGKVTVALSFAGQSKQIDVYGDRVWEETMVSFGPSEPEPFLTKPFSYDDAYGGVDVDPANPDNSKALMSNPVGTGYYPLTGGKSLIGKPLPSTSEPGNPVNQREGKYKPMSFGPIGRVFDPRPKYAGTYDQDWQDNVFPFLPEDFDPRYFQCAPPDQQFPYPTGGEEIVLTNLTPEGHVSFQLPILTLPIEFTDVSYDRKEQNAVADTILIEPDLGRFTITWRASYPLKRNIQEMAQCVVGRMPRGWYRARDLGKTYYPSLKSLIGSQTGELEEVE